MLENADRIWILRDDCFAPRMNVFEKIVAKQIPADIVYEDDLILAFRDVNPQAPVHVLLIPKKSIARVGAAGPEDQALLGHLLLRAQVVARKMGVFESGFRLVLNHGRDAGESVPHLHCHLLAGRAMTWPPG